MIRLELATGTEVIDLNSVLDPSSATVGEVTRTNLVTNPSFNAGLTGWDWNSVFDAYVQPDAMQRVSEGDGTYAARIDFADNTSKASTFYYSAIGLTEGQAHTISMDVWMSDNAQPVVLDAVFVKTSPPLDAAQGKGKWTRLSLTFTPTAAVTFVGIRSTVGNASGDSGWIKVKNVLLEQTPEVRPYFDGSTVAEEAYTYQWTGEAHASTSIQREHVVGPGVQALVGATGFGLPPVVSQYDEGAGDGATFRSQRFGPRVIDLPIYVDGRDRAGLVEQVSRMVAMLRKGCELRFYDTDAPGYWYLNVHLEGGFEFTYGEDTTGERDLLTVLTLKAGDPVWAYSEAKTGHADDSEESVTFSWEGIGDCPAKPVVTIAGPTLGFRILSGEGEPGEFPTGEEFIYTGFVSPGEKVIVDMENGTARDRNGANRWIHVGPSSRLVTIPGPRGWLRVERDLTSEEFVAHFAQPVVNHLVKPRVPFTASPYSWGDFEFAKTSGSKWETTGIMPDGMIVLVPGFSTKATEWGRQLATVTGLTPGEKYTWVTSLNERVTSGASHHRPTKRPVAQVYDASDKLINEGNPYAVLTDNEYDGDWWPYPDLVIPDINQEGYYRRTAYAVTFEAPADGIVKVGWRTPAEAFPNGGYLMYPRLLRRNGNNYHVFGAVLDGMGWTYSDYFDGDWWVGTGAYQYSWLGTPGNSKSQRAFRGQPTPDTSLAEIDVEFEPRRLVVI